MRIVITGLCGFVGATLAHCLKERIEGLELSGIDNLLRPGSEINRSRLRKAGVRVSHGDVRIRTDVDGLPDADWVIDAAANPSVLAGIDGGGGSRQLMEHNLFGTVNLLEYCRERGAGLVLLSSSRVYSIRAMSQLPVRVEGNAFVFEESSPCCAGVSKRGLREDFPVTAPVSLYGSTKLASETLASEYASTFNFPLWINRCGVMAGAGQFGTAEQGIFSFWLHAHARKQKLRFIGFEGKGWQVRDALHPADLADLIVAQISTGEKKRTIYNAGGGLENALSLAQLTAWCDARFGPNKPEPDLSSRPFDVPWLVMDSTLVSEHLGWQPKVNVETILEGIAAHVRDNPGWLELCEA